MRADHAPDRRRIGDTGTLAGECVGFLLLPCAPAHSRAVVPILILGWFVIGFSSAVSRVVSISIRQTVTPAAFLGRVNATHRFVSYGVVAIGTSAGGLLASAVGIRAAMAVAAVAMFASVACVLVSPLLRLRDVNTVAIQPPAEATPERIAVD
jgi:predicted MFS family arabinose efflux permease